MLPDCYRLFLESMASKMVTCYMVQRILRKMNYPLSTTRHQLLENSRRIFPVKHLYTFILYFFFFFLQRSYFFQVPLDVKPEILHRNIRHLNSVSVMWSPSSGFSFPSDRQQCCSSQCWSLQLAFKQRGLSGEIVADKPAPLVRLTEQGQSKWTTRLCVLHVTAKAGSGFLLHPWKEPLLVFSPLFF